MLGTKRSFKLKPMDELVPQVGDIVRIKGSTTHGSLFLLEDGSDATRLYGRALGDMFPATICHEGTDNLEVVVPGYQLTLTGALVPGRGSNAYDWLVTQALKDKRNQ